MTEWRIRDFQDVVLAIHVRRDMPGGSKTYFWKRPDGSIGLDGVHPSSMLYGAELIGQYPEAEVLIVEGEKAADAVRSVLDNGEWIVVANVCGAPHAFGDDVANRLRGRSTTLWPDADPPDEKGVHKGQLQADRHGELLDGRAGCVRLVHWPEAPPKGDAADYIATHSRDQVLALLAEARPWTPGLAQRLAGGAPPSTPTNGNGAHGGDRELPTIVVSGDLPAMTAQAAAALKAANDPPQLFTRGGELVRVVDDPDQGHVIRSLGLDGLRGELARCAIWLTVREEGDPRQSHPPVAVVRDLASLAVPAAGAAPPIMGLIEAPALRPDGSVIGRRGYDRATRLYFAGSGSVPTVLDRPGRDQVRACLAVLEDVLCDFPFDGESSKAGAIALFITSIVRAALGDSPVPMALLDAPKQGSGKSLLANIVALIATGREAASFSAPTDEAEWKKAIFARLLAGSGFVLIDNFEATDFRGNPLPLRSPTLSALLTASRYSDRVLGRSETMEVPTRSTWVATGNNIQVGGDLIRRCYRVRLDPKDSRPWLRTGFRHGNILEYVRARREELLVALLTMCRGWFAAGRPEPVSPSLGSFEAWSRMVGGILEYAGVPGFLADLADMYDQADAETPEWTAFLIAWREVLGDRWIKSGELARFIADAEGEATENQRRRMRDALPGDLTGSVESRGFSKRIGRALGKRAGTRHGDEQLYLLRREDDHAKQTEWTVRAGGGGRARSGDSPDSAGSAGIRGMSAATHMRAPAPAPTRGVDDYPQLPALPAESGESPDHDCPGCSRPGLPSEPDGWYCPECDRRWGQSATEGDLTP